MLTAKGALRTEEDEIYYQNATSKLKHFTNHPSVASYYRDCDAVNEFSAESYNEEYDSGIIRNAQSNHISVANSYVSQTVDAEDDLTKPSVETMQVSERQVSVNSATQVHSKQGVKLNARGITMIAVYAAVFLAIVIVVIINAVAISSLSASVAGLETELGAVQGEQTIKNNELNGVTHPGSGTIPDGYIKVSSGEVVKVELPVIGKRPEVKPSTNWFDAVCDFFSNIFGG